MVIIIAYERAAAFQFLNIYSEGHGGAYSARWIDAVGACLGRRFLFPLACENLEGPSCSVRDGHLVRHQKLKAGVT